MFICWKKFCYAALTAKTFANFASFLDPKMEVENGPKNGARIWPPKWGPKMAPKRGAQYSFGLKKIYKKSKALFKILGLPFGCHFWTPFWGSNSGTIFGSIFQPPFWGPKMVQNLQKFCCQSCIAKLFPASKHAYQNASVVIPSYLHLSTQFNSHLVKPSRITTNFDCHMCCT